MAKEVEYEIKTPEIEDIPLDEVEEPPLDTAPPEEEEEDDEEDWDDEEEDWDEDDSQSHGGLLGKVLLCILAFLMGVAVTSYYFTTMPEKESQEVEDIPVEVIPEPTTVQDLLLNGVSFGDTVTEMLLDNPELHALSHQGNHYGLFENDLEFPLDVAVTVGNIFYFYNDAKAMHAVQYLLRPEEGSLTTAEIQAITQALDEKYSLYYSGEGFSVWRCPDGYVGFQREMMYLYASQEEEQIRGVFLEEIDQVS